jgi:hypothetical protein
MYFLSQAETELSRVSSATDAKMNKEPRGVLEVSPGDVDSKYLLVRVGILVPRCFTSCASARNKVQLGFGNPNLSQTATMMK